LTVGVIRRAADVIVEAFKAGGKLLICGNDGSAAGVQPSS
jgi:phosphoheptose isomerase